MLHSLKEWEEKSIYLVERYIPPLGRIARRYQRLMRYLAAGSFSAAVDFLFLYILAGLLEVHYLLSSVLAFLVAFVASFTLQKFWTFEDHSTDRVHTQAVMYFIVAGLNLLLNTSLMYVFVERMLLWYMSAQFLASGLIACESFFISRYLFRKRASNGS